MISLISRFSSAMSLSRPFITISSLFCSACNHSPLFLCYSYSLSPRSCADFNWKERLGVFDTCIECSPLFCSSRSLCTPTCFFFKIPNSPLLKCSSQSLFRFFAPEFDIAFSFLLEVDLVAGLHLEDLLVRVLLSLLQHLFHRLHLFTRNMNAIWRLILSDFLSTASVCLSLMKMVLEKYV